MADTQYEYKILREKQDTVFLQKANALGREGWRIIHYHSEGMSVSALMELSKVLDASSKR